MAGPAKRKRLRTAVDADAESSHSAAENDVDGGEPSAKRRRTSQSRTLFVRSLAPSVTDESLTEFFSQHYPVKHATVVLDSQTKVSRGYGFVTFADADDAREASEKLQKAKLDGRPVHLELAEPRHRDAKNGLDSEQAREKRRAMLLEQRKPPKLIIRNLPWSIKKPEQLAALFRSYGMVKFADLPQSKGKLAGFGFVTIRGRKNAERAVAGVNGKVVDDRTLSVEFAVDKATWESQKTAGNGETKKASEEQKQSKGDATEELEKDNGSDEYDEDEDLKHFAMNYMDELESESDDDNDEDGGSGSDKASDEGPPSEDDESSEKGAKGSKKALITDTSSTLFIRNLPYTTTDEELKSHFSQFGRVRYARVVVDRQTDRPAGTGFVCFFNVEDSKSCLRGAPRVPQTTVRKKGSILQDTSVDRDGRYTIAGRVLRVAQAVPHDEAARLSAEETKKNQSRDKRHLYLLSEGTIPKSSPVFGLLTPSEIKMREASFNQRKKLLQANPTLHLSLTRLALRNIPRNIGSKELKALARQAVVGFAKDVKAGLRQSLSKDEVARGGEADKEAERQRRLKGKGIVKQAKIVFESSQGSKVPEKSGAGKSRGYGFIEYTSHRWALMGLRWLNGHALKNDAGKTQRLIVEFAIENAQVVKRRRELEARSRERAMASKLGVSKGGKPDAAERSKNGLKSAAAGADKAKAKADSEKRPKKAMKSAATGGDKAKKGKANPAVKRPKKTLKAAARGGGKWTKGKTGEAAVEGERKKPSLEAHLIARKRFMRKKKALARKGGN